MKKQLNNTLNTTLQLPFFYIEHFDKSIKSFALNESNSRHIVQVLRMQAGEMLHLADGKGHLLTATIIDAHKKQCSVKVNGISYQEPSNPDITIAISLLKNNNRFEWFLEKATEIGINAIVPLICERTEKEKAKPERLQNILISAMLQSRQVWIPQLAIPVSFKDFMNGAAFKSINQKFIAHCVANEKQPLKLTQPTNSFIILIGPEGDFTTDEIDMALQHDFLPVTLGTTRLRTETAGVVAASILKLA